MDSMRSHPTFGPYFALPNKPVHKDGLEEQPIPVLSLDPKDPRIEQVQEESELDPYSVGRSRKISTRQVNQSWHYMMN